MPLPTIQTARFELRALRSSDRDQWIATSRAIREASAQWLPEMPPGASWEMLFDEAIKSAAVEPFQATDVKLVATTHADDRIAGFFNLSQIFRRSFQNAYASWSVHPQLTRQGIGSEGVTALLGVAFAPPPKGLGLHRVQANIIPQNVASVRLAQKVGFRREGLAQEYLKIAGRWQDHIMFAKLASEHLPAGMDHNQGDFGQKSTSAG